MSPDGKYLAQLDGAGIHVKLLSTGDGRILSKSSGVSAAAWWCIDTWFPDSTQLLYDTAESTAQHSIGTVSVLGQSPRQLRDGAVGWRVSPDGTRIAFSSLEPASGSGR